MSGRPVHARPLQVLGLLPAAARRRLMSGMRSLGVLVSMLHPFGGELFPPRLAAGVLLPGVGISSGLGASESHTAGSEGRVMRRVSVHPVGASLPTLYSAPTANGVRNAFPRVGKLESSRECWFPQGEGTHWLGPHDRRPSPTLEKKRKKKKKLIH